MGRLWPWSASRGWEVAVGWEFMRSYRTEDSLVLEAPSVSYGKATTYLPVIDLLKRYAGIQPHDDARRIREQLTGKLFSLDRTLEPCLAPLLWLLNVPVEDGNWAQLDPSLRRQRVHEGLRRMLLRESREQLLVLVFEDLHWIDGETQAVLDGIVESLPTARVLLLVNYRPEYRHTWNSKTYYAQVRLDALPATSAAALLDALLGPDTSVQPLVPLLIKRTEGNPFFLEEMVANLVEARTLVGGPGAYRLVRAPEALSIPTTARAILSARIDRLTPEDKRLLQTAAVIGKDVSYPLLEIIADLEEGALRAGLSRLRDSEFLYEVQLFPELEHTFKHALTHEVAYGTLLGERRRALHARLVDAIEQVYAGRLDEQAERLAQHALRSELWERAVGYAQRAGMKAAFGASYREAVTAFEEALRAIERLAERRDVLEQAIDTRFKLRSSLQALGELARARDHLDRAHALATRLDDKRRLARAACYLGNYHFLCADSAASIAWGERALEAATASNDVLIAAETAAYLAMTYYFLGDLSLCMEWAKRSLTRLASSGLRELSRGRGRIQVFAHTYRVWCLAERGDFAAALAAGEDAEQLGVHPRTVRRALARGGPPTRRGGRRGSVLDPYRPLVDQWLAEGVWNAVVIWRELPGEGLHRRDLHPARLPASQARAAARAGDGPLRDRTRAATAERLGELPDRDRRRSDGGPPCREHPGASPVGSTSGARRPRTPSTRMRDWSGPSSGSVGPPARSWSTTRSVPCSRIHAGAWCASIPASWIWRGTTASSPAPAGRPGRRPRGRSSRGASTTSSATPSPGAPSGTSTTAIGTCGAGASRSPGAGSTGRSSGSRWRCSIRSNAPPSGRCRCIPGRWPSGSEPRFTPTVTSSSPGRTTQRRTGCSASRSGSGPPPARSKSATSMCWSPPISEPDPASGGR